MKKIKCDCGSPLFYLIEDDSDNQYAHCLWCALEGKKKPKFLLTGLVDLEELKELSC